MPSSTFSSDPAATRRDIPRQPWLTLFFVALVGVIAGFALWEQKVRSLGYGPTYNDTPNFWAEQRALAKGATREQFVFAGTSRTLFDMDLEVVHEAMGGPMPIQLATVGSNPMVVLADLAADENYAGTTIVDIVPGLIAAAAGPPISNPQGFVDHYHAWSPANRFELALVLWLEARLAFINQEDLSLPALLENHLGLPNRPEVFAPKLPDYMYTLDRARRGKMVDWIANDPQAMHKVQQTWVALGGGPPRPEVFTDEAWKKMLSDGWERNLASLVASVKAIEARGGRVIFSRLPSTDQVRDFEARNFPRADFWDRILRESGAPGIHFEDYPELRGFSCPEWSHLSGPDSVEYTRRWVKIMKSSGLL
jgi:hypothetical protein